MNRDLEHQELIRDLEHQDLIRELNRRRQVMRYPRDTYPAEAWLVIILVVIGLWVIWRTE